MTPAGKEESDSSADVIQSVDILTFIDIRKIPVQYLGTSYHLRPLQGDEAQYSHLRKTLSKTCNIAIVQVRMNRQQHIAALIPFENILRLHILHWENQPVCGEHYPAFLAEEGEGEEDVSNNRSQYVCRSRTKETPGRNMVRHSDGISPATRFPRRYSRIRLRPRD